MEPSFKSFDPNTITAEELAARFPDIGLFVAEDIVDTRQKNDGAFPDGGALVALGLSADLAREISACVSPGDSATAEPAPACEPPVASERPAFALPASEPPASDVFDVAAAAEVVAHPEPTATVFDVAAAPDVVDESEVEDDLSLPPPPPRRPVAAVVAAPVARVESAPRVAHVKSAPPVAHVESAPPVAHVESAPPVAHAESAPPVAPSVPAPASAPKRARRAGFVATLVVVNLAAIAGVVAGYQQERGTRKEVVTISADVGAVKTEQAAAKERADEALAKLEETRARLDEQAKALAQAKSRIAAAEARLLENERAAHEHEAQEAKETAALNSRVNHVEDKTLKLDEALKLLENFDR